MTELFLVFAIGYLLGSIPSGLIAGKLSKGIDLRDYGSGRTGATNTMRALGLKTSLAVLLADTAKGMLAIIVARWVAANTTAEAVAAVAAIAGHNWPFSVGFRGGRGVATSFGTLIVLLPAVSLLCAFTFALIVFITRFVSLGSLAGASITLITVVVLSSFGQVPTEYLIYAVVGVALLFFSHRDNIERLRNGTEHKLGEPMTQPKGVQ